MCAQHGRELMGWKSPVGVPTWTHRERRITTSRRQGQAREGLSGGSPSARGARLSPDMNSPEDCSYLPRTGPVTRRGLRGRNRNRIVKAEGCEASWHRTAKPTGTQPTETAALVHRQHPVGRVSGASRVTRRSTAATSGYASVTRPTLADHRDSGLVQCPNSAASEASPLPCS